MARILLIDDDVEFGSLLREQLTAQSHEVCYLDNAEAGLDALSSESPFDVVLLDNRMPAMTGIEFLAALKEQGVDLLDLPVILMTGFHWDQTVFEAMNLGAFNYVIKPDYFGKILEEFEPVIQEAIRRRPPRPVQIQQSPGLTPQEESVLIGKSKPMQEMLKKIGRFARMEEPILILGETGTGKDLVANAIHKYSPRKNKPFVAMNCGAFNDNLLDDELFGHEPGAFTGADTLRKGRFEHCHGGTVFLDEVGDMPLTLQVKLLRVLENREVVRLGSKDPNPIKVDVRVISATHCDLKTAVREKRFRQDLYYRLEGMPIHVPPLRERKEDIGLLATCFLARIRGAEAGLSLHPATLERMTEYPWPGNIRQLQMVLRRAVGMCRGNQIMPEDLDFGETEECASSHKEHNGAEAGLAGLRAAISWAWNHEREKLWPFLQEKLERELLQFALQQPGISQVQLARRLGIARNTLRARLEQYGLKLPELE